MTYRVSATHLEAWRRYRSGWIDAAGLRASLDYTTAPTPAMELGKRVHRILEDAALYVMSDEITQAEYEVIGIERDAFAQEVKEELRHVWSQPGAVPEVKIVRHVPALDVDLVVQLDLVCGRIGTEYKTTSSARGVSDFEDSMQWRACLYVGELARLDYVVLRLDDGPALRDVTRFSFLPYGALEEDVMESAGELLAWMKRHPAKAAA